MDLLKSTGFFFLGFIKRIWWLLPALLSNPFDIAERIFHVQYVVPQFITWLLLGLGIIIATILTYHDLRMQKLKLETKYEILEKTQSNLPRRPRKNMVNVLPVLFDLQSLMEKQHGHYDDTGLLQDLEDGIDTNIILTRNCLKCGKPRNQRGGSYE